MPTKSEEIFRVLEEQIVCCDLEPGTSLFEVKLSQRFHVSRTPVREALLKLERRGMIRSVPYKGFEVNPVSLKDVLELYELRTLLEVHNAGVAAGRMDEKTAAELRELLQKEYDDDSLESQKEFMHDDHKFHLILAELSQNRRIKNLLCDLLKHLQRIYFIGLRSHLGDASHEEHRHIISAILSGNAEEAKKVMEEHIQLAKNRALGALG